jgi:hypothetical protein
MPEGIEPQTLEAVEFYTSPHHPHFRANPFSRSLVNTSRVGVGLKFTNKNKFILAHILIRKKHAIPSV